MNYAKTLEWMFSRLPMYQTHGASAYKADLANTIALTEYLGNPQEKLKFIHVAGTNGKGSTSHMLASILQEAGYKTGLYTSPHLKDFRERIKINGQDISEEKVTAFIGEHKAFFEQYDLSFFEMSVGLAFDYFLSERVDIAIIEVGLGGRLDATNIITPLVSVITNIGIDHVQFLGNTVEAIASEKAGIIKDDIPLIIGEYTKESKKVFVEKAEQMNAPIYFASDLIGKTFPSDLHGDYQEANKKTVMQTIKTLVKNPVFVISEEDVTRGLLRVVENTNFRGRWQKLRDNPLVICDTAHNKHGLSVVMKQLIRQEYSALHIVLGVVNDKDLGEILPLFPNTANYYFCRPKIFRGLDAGVLQAEAQQFDLFGQIYNSVSEAYAAALQNASHSDIIYIGGSTFVVAEVL